MTLTSPTPDWERRYTDLSARRPPTDTTEAVSAPSLLSGDRLRWGGAYWEVTNCLPHGPLVTVTAIPLDPRAITIDFLAIELVDVLVPRPRKACR